MKKSGAYLARYALEQIGVRFTFGIPGVHNTEIYDELNKSEKIQPVLVTHEGPAAFMADAVSRTSGSIGTLAIVPAAGTTHAMSGIGEAFLDGIPMLIISGGIRRDTDKQYQLHQLDQEKLVRAVVKKYTLIQHHRDIIPAIYDAYDIAVSGEPGPVFIELPVDLQLFQGEVPDLPLYSFTATSPEPDEDLIREAADMLMKSSIPCIYAGWGAVHATEALKELADMLNAPVSTTLQGKSSFPENHPLHTGVGFGPSAVPAAEKAFAACECMLAIGVRFGELATGSFGVVVPENLIHIDINPEVFDKNYPTKIAITGDADIVLKKLINEIKISGWKSICNAELIHAEIQKNKQAYFSEWLKEFNSEKVSPGHFFKSLRAKVPEDTMMVVDDGKHTFLASELFPVFHPRYFISTTDFNCMGYCVTASIGVQLSNPDNKVVAIVGDGDFLMTGLELITAKSYGANIIVFVFSDGELGQISQFQKIPMNRKTCSVLGNINLEAIAMATGVEYVNILNDEAIETGISEALTKSEDSPVLVNVNIDYSKKTRLTKGVIKTNLGRFPLKEKIRFLSRAAKRHIFG